ncbi:copper chaperone PCu(A)C [Actinosynnema sp. NPDC049800]
MDRLRALVLRAVVAAVAVAVVSCGEPQRQLESGTIGSNGQVGDVELRNVVVEPPPEHRWRPGDDATVWLTLLSRADHADALVAVRSGAATRVELHADRDCDGTSEPVDRIEVPAEGATAGAASAYHLRLVDFTREVLAGTTVPLTFVFERAGETTLDAMVEATGDGDLMPPPVCESSPTSAPATATETSTPARAEVTLRGRVEAGVEAGCLVLATETGQFLLLGADPEVVRAGADVVVEGVAQPGQATTCQQGTPFAVRDARPAPPTR